MTIAIDRGASTDRRQREAFQKLGAVIDDLSASSGTPSGGLTWTKYTLSHTAFQTAGLTKDIELFSLPAGGVIHDIKIKHSQQFTGAGITAYTLSVGIASSLAKYASAFDVYALTSGTNFQLSVSIGSENHDSSVSIRIAAISNTSLGYSQTGIVEVWALTSVAK